MLRACALEFKGGWEKYIQLVEFAYNNSYHASIDMAPFEALYGRKCRTPVCWDEEGARQLASKEIMEWTMEKGVLKDKKRKKLTPRYIGPFEIIQRVGPVAYRLALQPKLSKLHDVFHVSALRKYVYDESHVLTEPQVDLEESLKFDTEPVEIQDFQEKHLRNKTVRMVRVLWRNKMFEEITWEREDLMKEKHPELFERDMKNFKDEIS
ncbi:uncharacterized protein LOC119981870 [Tripterygium wilfordii]|uniref:uncharacterized protein LOC119981870 n=1 Tax=Tripterygium wilfordii TaxID=458696 RepID=UPI0018F80814|nr:uncharacterized protein LOC119981870 [Tripterygium wilfordii]